MFEKMKAKWTIGLSHGEKKPVVNRASRSKYGKAHVIVGMGPCGKAAGSAATMEAILSYVASLNLTEVVIIRGDCTGSCDQEPIVQVQVGDEPFVIYGKVTPDIGRLIVQEHVWRGKIVEEYLLKPDEVPHK
jgi:NADP-reducing hydrogenase subunit HndB